MEIKIGKALPEDAADTLKEGSEKADFNSNKDCVDAEKLSPSEEKIALRKNESTDKNPDNGKKAGWFRAYLYPFIVTFAGIAVAFIRAGLFIAQYAGGAFDYFGTLISDIMLLFLFGALSIGGAIIALFCFLSGKKENRVSGLISLFVPLVLLVGAVISVLQVYFMNVIPPSVYYGYSKIDLYCVLFFRVTGVARTQEAYKLYDFTDAYYFDSILVAAVLCAVFVAFASVRARKKVSGNSGK